MPIAAQVRLDRQEAQQAEAEAQREPARRGRPPGRTRTPGIVQSRGAGIRYDPVIERAQPDDEPEAPPRPPVEAVRRALHPDQFDSYTEVKPEQVETKWPLFQAQVVYVGVNPKKSVSIKGTIISETHELPDGSVQKLDYVVPTEGCHVYEFWTTDTRGRRMPVYEPTVCGCAHLVQEHPADPTRPCGGHTVILAGPKRGQAEPCDCKSFSPRGRLMPMTTRDEAIRGRPMQFVQHPAHLRFFFRHKENGSPAFKVRILPAERSHWLEWLMRVERTEAKISEFSESTQIEDSSGWYVHVNETRPVSAE